MLLKRESVGAFIDAVYAIAATIMALEIPGELGAEFSVGVFWQTLLDYAMSFIVLFALWQQHRRINSLMANASRLTLWMTGLALLLVCLIPRATSLVFEYGGNVTLHQLERSMLHGTGWTVAEFVDLFYVSIVLAADMVLLGLAVLVTQARQDKEAIAVRHSKYAVSGAIVLLLMLSLLLPIQNRYFVLIIPVALIFERHLTVILFKFGNQR